LETKKSKIKKPQKDRDTGRAISDSPRSLGVSVVAVFFFICLTLTGCGYRILAPSWPEGISKIYVETNRNQTTEAGMDKIFTDALIQEFWHWGRVRIVNRDEAQAILSGIINDYAAAQPLSFDRDRTIREYRLTIRLNLRLQDASTGKTIWQENGITTQGDYQFFKDDLARTRSQENQAQRKAAADLAGRLLDHQFTGP
jgi:hypothetical protein